MIVITTKDHALHDPATMAPLPDGRPFYDRAARAEQLLSAVNKLGLPTEPAPDHGLAPIAAIHDRGYIDFLETSFARWQSTTQAGTAGTAGAHRGGHLQGRP